MKTIVVAAKIWAKTILFNALLFGLGAVVSQKFFSIVAAFILLVGGYIVTLPLLLLIVALINLSLKIPYSVPARIAWLCFNLMLVIIGFYGFFTYVVGVQTDGLVNIGALIGTTIAGLLLATYTTRNSLYKLNSQQDAQCLNVNN